MIRDICKDEAFLAQKSQPATLDDLSVGQDLLDTLTHHKEECVGMAANIDRREQAHHRLRQRGRLPGDVQPGDREEIRPLRDGGGLPVPSPAPGPPNGGSPSRCGGRMNVSRSGSRPFTGWDGSDHPARARPLSGDCDLGKAKI